MSDLSFFGDGRIVFHVKVNTYLQFKKCNLHFINRISDTNNTTIYSD